MPYGQSRPWPSEPGPVSPFNRWLDRVAGPHSHFAGLEIPSYTGFGVCGMITGFALVVALGLARGIPVAALAAISILSLALFLGAALIRRKLFGFDHVLLEDVLLVLTAAGLVCWAVGWPVGTTLDLLMVGLGAFLVFGRTGCLVSGCCHGRPSGVGIRYRHGAARGPLEGVRLFPIQLVEAMWTAVITLVGVIFVLAGAAPGTAVWFWLLAYGAVRFVLEFARGDVLRPQLGPLSEAQWLAVGLIAARAGYEAWLAQDPLPAVLVAAAVVVVLAGYWTRSLWLALPVPVLAEGEVPAWESFLGELERTARADRFRAKAAGDSPVSGLRLELEIDPSDGGREVHSYSLSAPGGPVDPRAGFAYAGLIAQRLPPHQLLRADVCGHGVFHLWALVDPAGPPGSTAEDHPRLVAYRAQAFTALLRRLPPPAAPVEAELEERFLPPAPVPAPAEPVRSWYFGQGSG